MPKPTKGARLGSGPSHQRLLISGLAAELIRHERIRTTETKAKRLRPVAERLITWGKAGTVHARRQALSLIQDRDVVHKLFAEIAPRFVGRNGGYTRILKLGPRQGDAAMMALIELVEGEVDAAADAASEAPAEPKRRRGALRRRSRAPATVAPEDEDAEAIDAEIETEPEAEAEPEPEAESEAEPVQEASPKEPISDITPEPSTGTPEAPPPPKTD